jgi:hypothetical protein
LQDGLRDRFPGRWTLAGGCNAIERLSDAAERPDREGCGQQAGKAQMMKNKRTRSTESRSAADCEMRALDDLIERLNAESAGVLDIGVITPTDAPDVFERAQAGNRECVKLFNAIEPLCEKIENAPKRSPVQCGSCQRALRDGNNNYLVVLPRRDDATESLCFAICLQCGSDHATAKARGLEVVRSVWPRLRALTITDPIGGNA